MLASRREEGDGMRRLETVWDSRETTLGAGEAILADGVTGRVRRGAGSVPSVLLEVARGSWRGRRHA